MKTIAFIPARGGSKSIHLKNIKEFCSKPLIYWSLDALDAVKEIDTIYVATDSDEIAKTIERFKLSKVNVYRRDPKNARDNSPTEDVILEFLSHNPCPPDSCFLLVQATSPLTETEDFTNAIKLYHTKKFDSLLACVRLKQFYWLYSVFCYQSSVFCLSTYHLYHLLMLKMNITRLFL